MKREAEDSLRQPEKYLGEREIEVHCSVQAIRNILVDHGDKTTLILAALLLEVQYFWDELGEDVSKTHCDPW